MKHYSLWVLGFMLILNGCSFLGFHSANKTVVITSPPVKIVASGQLDNDDYKHMKSLLSIASANDFVDYNFSNTSVSVISDEKYSDVIEDIQTQKDNK